MLPLYSTFSALKCKSVVNLRAKDCYGIYALPPVFYPISRETDNIVVATAEGNLTHCNLTVS